VAAYATQTDFAALGLASKATASVSSSDVDAALEAASRVVDSYIGSRFDLPLVLWDGSVTQAVVAIATYRILARRGYAAGTPESDVIRQGYEDAIAWCKDVAKGLALPSVTTTTDQSKPPIDPQAQPYVRSLQYSSTDGSAISARPVPRGW
jgi:phage gp36-like protein